MITADQIGDRRRGDRRKADAKFVLIIVVGMMTMYLIGFLQGKFFGAA